MDGGSYRAPRQSERAPTPWKPEDKQSAKSESKQVEQPTAPAPVVFRDETKKRRPFILPVIVILVIVAALAGWFIWSATQKDSGQTGINSDKYQAVFLTNGQVYFGKLQLLNNEFLQLTDVYYYVATQSNDEADPETESTQNVLTKLGAGGEVHGPEDQMMISKEQVLFYENLKTEGSVTKQILQLQ